MPQHPSPLYNNESVPMHHPAAHPHLRHRPRPPPPPPHRRAHHHALPHQKNKAQTILHAVDLAVDRREKPNVILFLFSRPVGLGCVLRVCDGGQSAMEDRRAGIQQGAPWAGSNYDPRTRSSRRNRSTQEMALYMIRSRGLSCFSIRRKARLYSMNYSPMGRSPNTAAQNAPPGPPPKSAPVTVEK